MILVIKPHLTLIFLDYSSGDEQWDSTLIKGACIPVRDDNHTLQGSSQQAGSCGGRDLVILRAWDAQDTTRGREALEQQGRGGGRVGGWDGVRIEGKLPDCSRKS